MGAVVGGSASAGAEIVNPQQPASPFPASTLEGPNSGLQRSARLALATFAKRGVAVLAVGSIALGGLVGCEADSFMDPSRTGYFETTPTTMPILSRLDVIEQQGPKRTMVTAPTPEDLVPGELKYRLAPGDFVRVEVFELISPGQTEILERTIDQTGNVRLKEVGDVVAAGLTIEEFQEEIAAKASRILENPVVSVSLERGQGFQFSVYGTVGSVGVFSLARPDFRLVEAIALAGGTIPTTQRVKVIRAAALDDTLNPIYPEPEVGRGPAPTAPTTPTEPGVDIDDLIEQLGGAAPAPAPEGQMTDDGMAAPAPGMLRDRRDLLGQDDAPAVDVDDLATPARVDTRPADEAPAPASGWTFDNATGRWVRGSSATPSTARPRRPDAVAEPSMYATRIIEIDYQELVKGDPNLNVVIRPGDQIYVEPPETGFLYVDGEINRVGVYELQNTNGRLTLSRFVSAAGGLAPTAIPSRVDLVRVIGKDREATIRVDLAAIRNRSEPDIYMQKDDHVIIGTNFYALPLAVIRNGFRMTYGFGFLLDRNFGNDVFGPPPFAGFGG
jgi:polysaccharide export outer membrane protein